jgi:hypothetical protein
MLLEQSPSLYPEVLVFRAAERELDCFCSLEPKLSSSHFAASQNRGKKLSLSLSVSLSQRMAKVPHRNTFRWQKPL